MARTFADSKAERTFTPLLIGLTSPSGGGKTRSALRLATGVQRVMKGDIFHIDTEAKRALHYADDFNFRHVPFGPPFSPQDYLEAIQHCAKKGAGVIIIDSMSHEHEGPGGVLESHAAELLRMGGGEKNNFRAWQKPKAARRSLINGLLQLQTCFIFCFRAKDKMKPVKKKAGDGGDGGMIELGWMPIAGEEFIYELTLSLLFPPQSMGIPNLDLDGLTESQRMMFKIPGQFASLFKQPRQLDESIGESLAKWATGGRILSSEVHAHNAAAAEALDSAGPSRPLTGPDQSEPCPLCKTNIPRCKKCNRELLFRKSEVHPTYGLRPGRWYCPDRCSPTVTTRTATDWHAVLEGDQRAAADPERVAIAAE